MIVQGHEWSASAIERCDVVVIGSGCGGATVAKRLAELGHDVVIVEKGGWYTAKDFDQREVNMLGKIDGGRGLQTSVDSSISLTYGNNVGGASVHYWADSYRTPPDRLALWAERYGMKGHGLAELTPHFERIEEDLHIHLADQSHTNRMNQLVFDGASALGWSVRRVPQARKGCMGSGHCMQGCSYDAKQSQLVTHLARADQLGARIYADLEAVSLRWNDTRIEALNARVLDRATGRTTGVNVSIEARIVVVAAGGFGTPLFLLRQGLKAHLSAVGEHLFCNPSPMVHALFDERIVQWRNIPAAWGVEEFRVAKMDGDRYVEGGYLLMPNQLQPGLLAAVLPGIGAKHHQLMAQMPNLGGTIAWIDDIDEGRVSLKGDRPRFYMPVDGGNGLRIRDAWRKQARLLFEVGAREVIFGDASDTRLTDPAAIDSTVDGLDLRPARNIFAAPHPGGCARMGDDPQSSVVGFDHRVHGIDNLYVSDPSVFPTAPSVDPSLTIMAFSYVAADHVHAALGS